MGQKDFLLAEMDFSSYGLKNVSDFHDEQALSVIESFDYAGLTLSEIDSKPVLYSVLKYADLKEAEEVKVLFHTSGGPESPSGFYITFEKASNRYLGYERPFSILAVGDIMLGREVRNRMDRTENHFYPFELISGKENRWFSGMDILFGNLEGPIYRDGVISGTSMVFGFPKYVTPVLSELSFDVVSVANNHTTNQGATGFESTYRELTDVGIGACGHPTKENEDSAVYRQLGGNLVGFVCFDDIDQLIDEDDAIAAIEEVELESDFVVVSMHAGVEYQHIPSARQISLAHSFVDAGADLVIGHHPHVVQPFEVYNGVPILYSLGNFVFDQDWSFDTIEELAYGIVVSENSYRLYLFPILSVRSQPALMDIDEQNKFYDRFISWGISFAKYNEELQKQIRNGVIEFGR